MVIMKKAEKKKEIQYYTEERWNNWIQNVKESDFRIDNEREDSTAIFVNMMDDVIMSCLRVVFEYRKKKTSADDALNAISSISNIVLANADPVNDDVDMMLQSLQSSLLGALVSCECYAKGGYNTKTPITRLIKDAISAEEEDPENALDIISAVGARVLSGKKMPEITFDIPDGLVAEWLDGIDSIVAAMALSQTE